MITAKRLIKRVSLGDMDSVKKRRSKLSEKEKDPALLTRCERLWNNLDGFRRQRARGNRFYDGDQWADLIKVNGETMTYREYLMRRGNVVIQTNQIKNRVDTIVGVMVKENKEPVCHAIDREEQQLGEVMTEAVQANCDKNTMSELYMKWMKELCNGGLAVAYESYDDYSGPGRGLDAWTQYISPGTFFFDTCGVDPRFWDVSIVGRFFYGSFEEISARFAKSLSDYAALEEIYAQQSDVFKSERAIEFEDKMDDDTLVFMQSSDPTRCYVCEVWTKETRPRIRLNDLNEGTEEIIDANDAEYRRIVRQENESRKKLAIESGWNPNEVPYIIGDGYGKDDIERNGFFIDTIWYCRYLAPDGTILWEGESPYPDKLHPFSFCIYSYLDGNIVGYTHDAIDHNIAMNRAWILSDWVTRAQAKGVTVVPKSIVPADTDYKKFANSWTELDDVIFIDLKPGQEGLMPKTFYGAAQNFDASRLIQTIQNMMDNGSPVNGALQGKTPASGTSGALYAQMSTNAATPIAALMTQFHNFVRGVLYKKMKNIAKFYDKERFARISGQIENLDAGLNLNDIRNIEYDLRITESADTPVFREMQEQDLTNFLQMGLISFDEYLALSSKPYADRLLQMRQANEAEAQAVPTTERTAVRQS